MRVISTSVYPKLTNCEEDAQKWWQIEMLVISTSAYPQWTNFKKDA